MNSPRRYIATARARNALKSRTLIYRIRICWRVKVSRGYRASIYHKPTSRIVRVPVINRLAKLVHVPCLWRVLPVHSGDLSFGFWTEGSRCEGPVPRSLRWQNDRFQFSCFMVSLSRRICKGKEFSCGCKILHFKLTLLRVAFIFCIINQPFCKSNFLQICFLRIWRILLRVCSDI